MCWGGRRTDGRYYSRWKQSFMTSLMKWWVAKLNARLFRKFSIWLRSMMNYRLKFHQSTKHKRNFHQLAYKIFGFVRKPMVSGRRKPMASGRRRYISDKTGFRTVSRIASFNLRNLNDLDFIFNLYNDLFIISY